MLAEQLRSVEKIAEQSKSQAQKAREELEQKESERQSLLEQFSLSERKATEALHDLDVTKAQAKDLEAKLGSTAQQASEALQTQRITQKMLAKTDSDLSAIRLLYEEKTAETDKLRQLVSQLRDRLKVASSLYQQLLEEEPEVLRQLQLER